MNFTYRLIPYIFVNLKGNSIDSMLTMLVIFSSLNLQKVRKARYLDSAFVCAQRTKYILFYLYANYENKLVQ